VNGLLKHLSGAALVLAGALAINAFGLVLRAEHAPVAPGRSALASASASGRPSPSPSPSPSASTTAAAPDHDLIWYSYVSSNIVASNWSGQVRGTIALRAGGQSPDGSKLLGGTSAGTAQIIDSTGKILGALPAIRTYIMWADDSSGLCILGGNLRGDELQFVSPAGRVTNVASIPPPATPPQVMKLAACSELMHRALVYGYGFGHVYSVSLISLDDGHVIYRYVYPGQVDNVVASPDGGLVAEQSGAYRPITQIRQMPSGTIVGHLTGDYVHGFSWDGSLMVVDTSGYAGAGRAEVMVRSTYDVLWQMADNSFPFVLAPPNGSEVAVAIGRTPEPTGGIYVIHADGRATEIVWGKDPFQPF
jgi:hypothetical protein